MAVIAGAAAIAATGAVGATLILRGGGPPAPRTATVVPRPSAAPTVATATPASSPTPAPTPTPTATPGHSPSGPRSSSSASPLPAVGSLGAGVRVSGNRLVDATGAAVSLAGVNVSGTEFACDQGGGPTNRGWSIYGGQPLDRLATYQAISGWHMRVVRVPLNEDCWLGINGVKAAYAGNSYRSAISTEVSLIHRAGMIAILDLHWSSPGAYAAVAQQPMPDADHSVTFWQSIATAYKSDPAVIFDLFNEPFLYGSYFSNASQDPWACWLNGCSLKQFVSGGQVGPNGVATGYQTTYTWKTAGVQTLISAIRQAGAAQPILVNGLDWANDDSGWLAHRPNDPLAQIIVGAHIYPGESCQLSSCWNSVFTTIDRLYPVLVGETGDHSNSAPSFLPTLIPYADSHRWSYLAWTWNPWADASNVVIRDWSGTPTPGEGSYLRQHLLSLR
jgi:endoglucanase